MHLTGEELQAAVIKKSDRSVEFSASYPLKISQEEVHVPAFREEVVFAYQYDGYVATAEGGRNTLMPTDLFRHTQKDAVFRLNYTAPHDHLASDRIAEQGIVNVYELPRRVHALFAVPFPRVKLLHPVSVLLRAFLPPTAPRTTLYLYPEKARCYLFLTSPSQLVYYNCFDVVDAADLIYYILFVLDQRQLDQTEVDFQVCGASDRWKPLQSIQDFFDCTISTPDKGTPPSHFLLTHQALCV